MYVDAVPFGKEDISTVCRTLEDFNAFHGEFYKCRGKQAEGFCVLISLAVDFCTDIQTARRIKEDLVSKKISRSEAFAQILEDWLSGQDGNKASIQDLISVFSSNDLTDAAGGAKMLLYELSLPKNNAVVKSDKEEDLVKEAEGEEFTAIVSNPSMKKALSNSVILEEIFKKLSIDDKRNFRLVSSFWWRESLSFWRRSLRIQISNRVDENVRDRHDPSIPLRNFVELFQEEGEGFGTSATGVIQNRHKLLDPPYRSYAFWHNVFLPKEQIVNREFEREFWKSCGPFMEHVTLTYVYSPVGVFYKIFQKLVLDLAPNLKQFRIEFNCLEEEATEDVPLPWETEEYPADKLAEKMETLIIETYINHEETKRIFQMCPNLKSLDASDLTNIEGLLQPAGNGEYIKLQKMILQVPSKMESFRGQPPPGDSLLALRKYVEMLPDTLKNLKISLEEFKTARRGPHLYAALAQCRSLQSLELQARRSRHYHNHQSEDFPQWFMDLSIFSFRKLLKLKFVARKSSRYVLSSHFLQKFDFGTLKGMEKLEELDVQVPGLTENSFRKSGTKDWIYEGWRDHFAPSDFHTDYVYLEDKPILCENLKQFNFRGWEITAEDVTLIAKWFPNLTSLNAPISTGALSVVVESWKKLEKLEIHTNDFICLSQLQKLKEKNKYLKIIIHFSKNESCYQPETPSLDVEVKENENGGLYYDSYDPPVDEDYHDSDDDEDDGDDSNSSFDMDDFD